MKYHRENCLQYNGKIIKIRLGEWTWGNGVEAPEGLEVIVKISDVSEGQMNGSMLASDNLPVLVPGDTDGVVVIKYHIIDFIEVVQESDIALFVGYPNTYVLLSELLKGV